MKQQYSNSNKDSFFTIKNLFFTLQKKTSIHAFYGLGVILFLFTNTTLAQTTFTDNTSGTRTFTVPCDVTSITIQAWGGGGAGGGVNVNPSGGGGGGGGGYCTYTVAVTAGQVITYTVGAGGTGSGGNGGNGGITTILALTANGGTGGIANNGTGGTGGTASGGITNTTGANGGSGTTSLGAAGGDCLGVGGGIGGTSRNTRGTGFTGTIPGGGGGGGLKTNGTNYSGGNGGNGQISITYTSLFSSCIPTFTSANGIEPITNVTFAGINNTTTNAVTTGNPSLETFCSPTATVVQGSTTNAISVKGNTNGNFITFIRVYIDWNKNGTYGDLTNEIYDLGTITNSTGIDAITLTGNITVPFSALVGTTGMRVIKRYGGYPTGPCQTGGGFGQAEDYVVNVTAAPACTTPTTQPTALSLTPTTAGFTGTFTAASPAPNSYIVVANTTGITPTPTNGTTYTIGSLMGAGNQVIAITNTPSFTASGVLLPSTFYNVYIFSFNGLCSGGPLYRSPSPLTGSGTTLGATAYCSPSVTSGLQSQNYITQVNFIGNIVNTTNPSTFSNTPIGYQDFTVFGSSRATQAQGEGVNVFVDTNAVTAVYMKVWVDWNKDGLFDDTTEIVYQCSNAFLNTTFGFKIPITAPIGLYRIRLRINKSNSPTDNLYTSCGNINNNGETEDYLFTVIDACSAKINTITPNFNCGTGTVTLGAVGTAGTTEYRWYDAEIVGTGTLVGTSTTSSWTTPSISATTTYYVTAFNGTCESLFRTPVKATIKPVPGISFTNATPTICGENSIIDVQATGNNEQVFLIDENFESGLGTFTNNNIASPDQPKTNWQVQVSPYVPQYPTFPVWYPAISSGITGNKFAMSTSDLVAGGNIFGKVENALESAVVNTTGFVNLSLSFDMYFSSYYDLATPTQEVVVVETKIGAGAWTAVPTAQYTTDVGIGTLFVTQTYNMAAYVGNASFQVRIRYKANWCDGVAIDDIKLFGDRPLSPFFTYSGGVNAFTDAAATIPYTGTPASIIYLKPTLLQLEQNTFTIVATANLTNGCTTSGNINVTNNTKVWKGTTNNDWNTATNWSTGFVPTIGTCVIIPPSTPQTYLNTGAAGLGKNLLVKDGGILEVQGGNSLTIKETVIVEPTGTFNIKNNSSLAQIDNVVNTGNVNMERIANIRRTDYVYWSTPVTTFNSSAISPGTTGNIYKWIPTIAANTPNGWGNWANGSEAMTLGKGYIVRGPDAYTAALQNYTANFIGIPNNGNLTTPVSRGTYAGVNYSTGVSTTLATQDDDNWNLLGNPYPSAINPTSFLAANTNLAGFVKVWSHGTAPSTVPLDPFYNDYIYNYTPGDYITYNGSGSTVGPGVNNIAAGQGFFVLMNHSSAATTETAVFNNSMRRDGSGNVYSNNQFYKSTLNNAQTIDIERNRIWLDLIAPNNTNVRTLVGYIEGATNDNDRMFDAFTDEKLSLNLYSVVNGTAMSIQGKALPFNDQDTILLGFKASSSGFHKIAIATVDGIFTSQNIYLEDTLLNIIHDLKQSPYTFTTNAGIFNDRFVLRYTQNALGNQAYDYSNDIKIFTKDYINVTSTSQSIKEVIVYDALGKTVLDKQQIGKTEITLNELKPVNNVLIVKVILENDVVVTKKVIY